MPKNLRKNINRENLRDIYRLNILATSTVFVCSLLFLLMFENRKVAIIMTVKSGGYIFITSFTLVYILKYCVRRFHDNISLYRFWKYFLSYVFGISLYQFFWHVFASYAGILQRSNDTKWLLTYTMVAIIITTVLLMLQDFVVTRRAKIQADLEYSRLETKNKEAENLLLKQQIQPHFLFNALSTLKSLIDADIEKSQYYLMHLAEFLRVAISHNRSFTATLEEELSICKTYMVLQKIRFGTALEWEIVVENEDKLKGYVPSLSLQPLIENAIKHNALTTEFPLRITIKQYGAVIEVSNSIRHKTYGESSTRSGLGNLAERYALLTDEHINVTNDGKIFSVSFNILDNENNNN